MRYLRKLYKANYMGLVSCSAAVKIIEQMKSPSCIKNGDQFEIIDDTRGTHVSIAHRTIVCRDFINFPSNDVIIDVINSRVFIREAKCSERAQYNRNNHITGANCNPGNGYVFIPELKKEQFVKVEYVMDKVFGIYVIVDPNATFTSPLDKKTKIYNNGAIYLSKKFKPYMRPILPVWKREDGKIIIEGAPGKCKKCGAPISRYKTPVTELCYGCGGKSLLDMKVQMICNDFLRRK